MNSILTSLCKACGIDRYVCALSIAIFHNLPLSSLGTRVWCDQYAVRRTQTASFLQGRFRYVYSDNHFGQARRGSNHDTGQAHSPTSKNGYAFVACQSSLLYNASIGGRKSTTQRSCLQKTHLWRQFVNISLSPRYCHVFCKGTHVGKARLLLVLTHCWPMCFLTEVATSTTQNKGHGDPISCHEI